MRVIHYQTEERRRLCGMLLVTSKVIPKIGNVVCDIFFNPSHTDFEITDFIKHSKKQRSIGKLAKRSLLTSVYTYRKNFMVEKTWN